MSTKEKFNFYFNKLFTYIVLASVFIGVLSRMYLFLQSEPEPSSDLIPNMNLWYGLINAQILSEDITRFGQWGFSILMGVFSYIFGINIPESVMLISALSSILLIPVIGLLTFSLTENKFDAYASIILCSQSWFLIKFANFGGSEPVYLLFLISSIILIIHYYRTEKKISILVVFFITLSCSIRPTVFIHLIIAGIGIAFYEMLFNKSTNRNLLFRNIIILILIPVITSAVFSKLSMSIYNKNFSEEYGFKPINYSHTKYVVKDGILLGPFNKNKKNRLQRESEFKSINPLTGKVRWYDLVNETYYDIISNNLSTYTKNYFNGVLLVIKEFTQNHKVNHFGFPIILLGLLLILYEKKKFALIFLLSWLMIYIFIMPLTIMDTRYLFPSSIAFIIIGSLFYSRVFQFFNNLGNDQFFLKSILRLIFIYIVLFVPFKQLAYIGFKMKYHQDPRQKAFSAIKKPTKNESIGILTNDAGICLYGEFSSYIPLPFDTEEKKLNKYISDQKPDYLFLFGKYNETWSGVINIFDEYIFTNNNKFVFDLVWNDNSSKLFSIKYRN